MTLSKEVKTNAKILYTLSVSEDNKDYNESYTFLSLNTLIDTVKTNLANDYLAYDVYNGMEYLNPAVVKEQLSSGYGVTIALKKVRNETSSILEELFPKTIHMVIGTEIVY